MEEKCCFFYHCCHSNETICCYVHKNSCMIQLEHRVCKFIKMFHFFPRSLFLSAICHFSQWNYSTRKILYIRKLHAILNKNTFNCVWFEAVFVGIANFIQLISVLSACHPYINRLHSNMCMVSVYIHIPRWVIKSSPKHLSLSLCVPFSWMIRCFFYVYKYHIVANYCFLPSWLFTHGQL